MKLTGILARLQAEGALRLYHDYRSGTFRDWSGLGNHGTPVGTIAFSRKGISIRSATGCVTVTNHASIQLTTFSICTSLIQQYQQAVTYNGIAGKYLGTGGTRQLDLSELSGVLYLQWQGSSSTFNPHNLFPGEFNLGINVDSGSVPNLYSNGTSKGNFVNNASPVIDNQNLAIGSRITGGTNPWQGSIKYFVMCSRVLTAAEHQELYEQLQTMSWPTKSICRASVNSAPNTSDPTLVRSIGGKVVGGKILDAKGVAALTTAPGVSSRSSLVGTLHSGISTTMAANTNLASTYPQTANEYFTANVFTTRLTNGSTLLSSANANIGWGVFVSASIFIQAAVAGTTRYHSVSFGTYLPECPYLLSVKYDYNHSAYYISINGKPYSSGITVGIYASVFPTGLFLGGRGVLGTNVGSLGPLGRAEIYSGLKTDVWAREQWVKIAQAVQFQTAWGIKQSVANESTVGNFVGSGSSPFEILSGTWKVSIQEYNGELHKALECVSAGTVWLDRSWMNINSTEAAYGAWRFLVSHADSATPTTIALTATAKETPSVTTGNYVRVYNTETRMGTYNAGSFTDFETLATGGGATAPLEVQARRRFDNVWSHHNKLLGAAWLTSAEDTNATYTTSAGMSVTANAGDWVSLGTVNGDHGLTKYLGEFSPLEA